MDWKEFIRPRLWKIIIFVILGIILLVSFVFSIELLCIAGGCPQAPKWAVLLFNILALPVFLIIQSPFRGNDAIAIVSMVLTPFYLYLISSGIVILYQKIRKN